MCMARNQEIGDQVSEISYRGSGEQSAFPIPYFSDSRISSGLTGNL
jgi:hypothetical protein